MAKQIIKKILPILTIAMLPGTTGAVGTKNAEQNLEKAAGQANLWGRTFGSISGEIIKSILAYAGIIMLVLIAYGGILWMTAGGKEEQISKAKKIIVGSIVGFMIAILAYTIVYGVVSFINKL